jgi:CoA:oxalate CoA-transferase
MLDSMIALQPLVVARYLASGTAPARVGNRHPLSAPFGAFRASDESFVIAVLNEKLFTVLARVIGKPDIAKDPRFATDSSRSANESILRQAIEEWSLHRTAREAVGILAAAGVPAAEIQTMAEALRLRASRCARPVAADDPSDAWHHPHTGTAGAF